MIIPVVSCSFNLNRGLSTVSARGKFEGSGWGSAPAAGLERRTRTTTGFFVENFGRRLQQSSDSCWRSWLGSGDGFINDVYCSIRWSCADTVQEIPKGQVRLKTTPRFFTNLRVWESRGTKLKFSHTKWQMACYIKYLLSTKNVSFVDRKKWGNICYLLSMYKDSLSRKGNWYCHWRYTTKFIYVVRLKIHHEIHLCR